MRPIKTLSDAELVLRDLTNWKSRMTTQDLDMGGRRIVNVGAARSSTDVPSLSQIPPPTKIESQRRRELFYTFVYATDAAVSVDQVIPAFIIGNGREGIPHQVWVMARVPPSGGPLSINLNIRTIDIDDNDVDTALLPIDLDFPDGGVRKVYTSTFTDPAPVLGNLIECWPTISAANGAECVSIGVVVKVIK